MIIIILVIMVIVFADKLIPNKQVSIVPSFPNTGAQNAAVDDVVIFANDSPAITGTRWTIVDEPTASSGKGLLNPDLGETVNLPGALSTPNGFTEYTFTAAANTSYHIWFRGKALSNAANNGAVYAQFSDSLTDAGAVDYRIGSSSQKITLTLGEGTNPAGWGWNDNSASTLGANIKFAATGTHTIRILQKFDGITIDEIVLSPSTFLAVSPGTFLNDTNFVLKYNSAPTISSIAATNVTATGATITWSTDQSTTSLLNYGLTTAYGSTGNSAGTTAHSVTLTGLTPDTLYNYQISATNASAINTLSANQTFTTTITDVTPPVISGITVSALTLTGATISWTTNENSTSSVAYGPTTAYGSTSNSAGTTSHSVVLSGLASGTTYNYQISATDAGLNNTLSANQTFATYAVLVQPELPRTFLDTTYPTLSLTRKVWSVKADCAAINDCTTSLQTAIDGAALGDEIVIDAGLIVDGPITLKEKTTGSGWIVIRSANIASLPVGGVRVSPADSVNMPKIVSIAGSSNGTALLTADRAHNYRLVGIEFMEKVPNDDSNVLVQLGPADSYCPTTEDLYVVCTDQSLLDRFASDIILDRVYIHGDPQHNVRRGVGLDSKSSAVINSYIADIHVVGQEASGITGAYGPGPYKIVNNYVSAATQDTLFGGDDPRLANVVPSDIEVRNNFYTKSLTWKVGDPSYAGKHWLEKNVFELKNARRVLVEGNSFNYAWVDGQTGYAILFTPRNQGGRCPWCVVEDVTFQNNIVNHAGSGVQVLGHDNNGTSALTQRIKISNNIWDDIDSAKWGGSGIWALLSSGTTDPGPSHVQLLHNTIFNNGIVISPLAAHGTSPVVFDPKPNFVATDNIAPHNTYGVKGDNDSTGNLTLNHYFPGGTFTKNILKGGTASLYNQYAGNFFPPDWSTVFVNQGAGDYHVLAPYVGTGTDNKDIGANVDDIALATASAISGISTTTYPYPTPYETPYVTPYPTPYETPYETPSSDGGGGGGYQTPASTPEPTPTPSPTPTPEPTPLPIPTPLPTPTPSPTGSLPLAIEPGVQENPLYPDGKLILDQGVIYVMDSGLKRPYVSMPVFLSYGLKTSDLKEFDSSAIPSGEPIFVGGLRHARGSLVNDAGTIYFLGRDQRYGFPSEEAFFSWGNQFKDVVSANATDEAIPEGGVVEVNARVNAPDQTPLLPSTGQAPSPTPMPMNRIYLIAGAVLLGIVLLFWIWRRPTSPIK